MVRDEAVLAIALGDRPLSPFDPASEDVSPGRRIRVFAALVSKRRAQLAFLGETEGWLSEPQPESTTYGRLLEAVESGKCSLAAYESLSCLPLRVGYVGQLISSIPVDASRSHDPELHFALQDLANEINEDIREALEVLQDPRAHYCGVDEGIEPVTDEHVSLVIWALQRELNRELRSPDGFPSARTALPAAPLSELPWDIQRALVERRRLRFKQWGIGREGWARGEWSLWDIPPDVHYVPRRTQRLAVR